LFFEDVLNMAAKNKISLKNNLFSQTGTLVQLDRFPVRNGTKPPNVVAKWIWTNEGDPGKEAPIGNRFFRTTFTPGKKVTRAILDVGVDDDVVIWINGKELIKQGIGRVQVHDVTPFLTPGKNALAAMATNKAGPAALLIQLTATLEGGNPLKLGTDQNWKANPTE